MKKFIRQLRGARAAFTLMEVNLAIFIMAVGVLAMTSLYPLGFRENQQARDDVRAAIVADEVLGQLTAALSSRNITWSQWRNAVEGAVAASKKGSQNAWFAYMKRESVHDSDSGRDTTEYVPVDTKEANSIAGGVFDKLAEVADSPKPKWIRDDDFAHGLVVQWGKRVVDGVARDDYSRASISFRMARRAGALMTAPIYYTEVHFQGDQKGMEQ